MRRVLAAGAVLLAAGCVPLAPVKWPDMQAASLPHSSGGSPPYAASTAPEVTGLPYSRRGSPPYTAATPPVDSAPRSTTPMELIPPSIPHSTPSPPIAQWRPPSPQFNEVPLEEYDGK